MRADSEAHPAGTPRSRQSSRSEDKELGRSTPLDRSRNSSLSSSFSGSFNSSSNSSSNGSLSTSPRDSGEVPMQPGTQVTLLAAVHNI